jgi:hypothetical protein
LEDVANDHPEVTSKGKKMTHLQWFHEQLSNSMAGFVWAVEHIPTERWLNLPPGPDWLGQWSLARHVFHLQYQEQYVVQPGIQSMLHLPITAGERPEEEKAWQTTTSK